MMRWMRGKRDLGIEGRSARWYDRDTRAHRMDEMRSYARAVATAVGEGAEILEIAPGPGYLAIELARIGRYRIVGVDISRDFVDIARRNAAEAGVAVDFRQGSAAAIPLADASVNFIICTAAFKNFREPEKALAEMHRVLRPGGTARIIDMSRDASTAEIADLVRQMGLRGMKALSMKLMFRHFLRRGAYSRQEFEALIQRSAFGDAEITRAGIGFSIDLKKSAVRLTPRSGAPLRAA